MDSEVGGDLLDRHTVLAVAGDPHNIVTKLSGVGPWHNNILPARPPGQAISDVTCSCSTPVVKIHGYCVAGGTDIALHADQVIAAADAKIGYPPMRVWGVPAAGLWAHRLGDQRAKRLLLTGDCITGAQAAEWGLAIEAPDAEDLDDRTERLVERIAAMPVNQLIMAKLAMNTVLYQQGVATSRMVSTVFDGIARHTPEGHAFVADAQEHGFREAVRHRDEPFGDFGRKASGV